MSLVKIQGKIQKAGAYPLKAPKTVTFNGKEKTLTHRHTVQMESGEWIGFGESHLDSFLVKDDDDNFQILGAGSEVLIKYTANGDFKNAKKANLTILDLVKGIKFEKDAPPVQNTQQSNTQGGNKGNFVNPAEIGQCLNLAAEVLKLNAEQLLDDTEVTKAIAWYKSVREKFNELYTGVEAGTTEEKPKPKPAKKKVVVEDDYDDMDV